MRGDDWELEGRRVEAARQKLQEDHCKFEEERRRLLEERKRALGFAASAVLPGENQVAFDQLLKQLRIEYQPEGIVQQDAVRTMAQAIWRKQYLDIFQRAAEARARWGTYFRFPNDRAGFFTIMRDMIAEYAGELERRLKLSADTNAQQETATPPTESHHDTPSSEEVKSPSAFSDIGREVKFAGVLKDINGAIEEALNDAAEEALPPPSQESEIVGRYTLDQILLAQAGNLLTPECYLAELRMIEQLDGVIERCHNTLTKMKKDSKANRAPPNRASSLTPGWASRRR